MNELEKTVTDLGHIKAKAHFDSGKFLNDLNSYLNECMKLWVTKYLNNYVEVDLPKLDDTGDKNGDQKKQV